MAASSDDELSFEVPQPDGKVGGVFTMALAQTLRGLTSPASATLGDIADEVRARVVATGARDQHPAAEGQLEATLGGPARRVALVGATMAGGAVSLDAGAASGMTVGSTFALYRGRASALAEPPGKPLGTGHIGAVAPFTASLMLDGAAAGSPQSAMQARETAHVYGERVLRAALGRLATVQALMALRTDPASAALGLSVSDCAGRATAGPIGVGRDVTITIANRDPGHARYLYVFGIDETQAVYPFIPVVGGRDPAVPPTQALNQRLAFNAPGQYHFVAPASPMAGLQKGVTP
jgi:hypothetical protein